VEQLLLFPPPVNILSEKKLPERVSSADPVPELEHVPGVDAELDDFRAVGRQGDEVLGHGRILKKKNGSYFQLDN
jgi:hypothetical protein